jgi:hypothetical protein
MNTNLYDRDGFVLKEVPIRTDEDRHACMRMLLAKDRHMTLCRSEYSEEHIRAYVEHGTAFLYYHPVGDIETMVCFAIVKQKKRVLDILLVCAAPNTQNFGTMIAYAIYAYAIMKKCKKLYAAPRTERLRATFMHYGFTHLRGVRGIDEVFEKNGDYDDNTAYKVYTPCRTKPYAPPQSRPTSIDTHQCTQFAVARRQQLYRRVRGGAFNSAVDISESKVWEAGQPAPTQPPSLHSGSASVL